MRRGGRPETPFNKYRADLNAALVKAGSYMASRQLAEKMFLAGRDDVADAAERIIQLRGGFRKRRDDDTA